MDQFSTKYVKAFIVFVRRETLEKYRVVWSVSWNIGLGDQYSMKKLVPGPVAALAHHRKVVSPGSAIFFWVRECVCVFVSL